MMRAGLRPEQLNVDELHLTSVATETLAQRVDLRLADGNEDGLPGLQTFAHEGAGGGGELGLAAIQQRLVAETGVPPGDQIQSIQRHNSTERTS